MTTFHPLPGIAPASRLIITGSPFLSFAGAGTRYLARALPTSLARRAAQTDEGSDAGMPREGGNGSDTGLGYCDCSVDNN